MFLKKYHLYILILFSGILLTSLQACVEPYSINIDSGTSIILIEGNITDLPEPQTITLSHSNLGKYKSTDKVTSITFDSASRKPLINAKVEVIVNGKETFSLNEVADGTYQLPDGFIGKVGNSYQLRFKTSEGAQYESNAEIMVKGPDIKKAYDNFNQKGIYDPVRYEYTATNDVYIDYDDPVSDKNFYKWDWVLWEEQYWCATCQQGYYVLYDLGNRSYGECIQDPTLNTYNFFDYPCMDQAWDIFYSTKINISSDIFTNGQSQKGKLIAQIPLNQSNACLVALRQNSITTGAYRYYKILQDQTQNTGTLADSPPAPTAGNVKNINNPDENTFGYFSASSVSVLKYYMNRQNTTGGRFNGLFLSINKRIPNLPVGNYPHSSATCVPSKYRTCSKPLGWP